MVTHRYARNSEHNTIDVQTLLNENNKSERLFCLSCDREMTAKLGAQREWHFAHKHDGLALNCSQETYLHNAAKNLLYENIQKRLQQNQQYLLPITRPIVCDKCHFPFSPYQDCVLGKDNSNFDLLSKFREARLESYVAGFKPDICLSSNEAKLFIEIAVSHRVEQAKIDSGYRIIEIEISSEADLKHLSSDILNPRLLIINRYNFESKPIRKSIKPTECTQGDKRRFILYKSGKSVIAPKMSYYEVTKLSESALYIADIPDELPESEAYLKELSKVARYNLKITNCHFCRYHGYESSFGFISERVFCKYYKQPVSNTNKAASCEIYKFDKTTFYPSYIENEEDFK